MFIEPVFGKKFFGREEVLGTLQKRVTSLKGGYRQNMALTGPMLAGKSSILRHFLHNIKDPNVIPLYIELDGIDFNMFCTRFMATLLFRYLKSERKNAEGDFDDLKRSCADLIPETVSHMDKVTASIQRKRSNIAYKDLLELTSVFKAETGKNCIVILDEFHNISNFRLKKPFQVFGKFIMVQKNTMYVVSSSQKTLLREILSRKLSLLFGNFEVLEVNGFDSQTARSFMSDKIDDDGGLKNVKNYFIQVTQGNPFYLEVLSGTFSELLKTCDGKYDIKEVLLDTFSLLLYGSDGVLNQYFSNTMNFFLEKKVRKSLIPVMVSMARGNNTLKSIQKDMGKVDKDLSNKLHQLESMDIVYNSGVFYKISDKLFEYWLKNVFDLKATSIIDDMDIKYIEFKQAVDADFEKYCRFSEKSVETVVRDLFKSFSNEKIKIGSNFRKVPYFDKVLKYDISDNVTRITGAIDNKRWVCNIKKNDITDEQDISDLWEFKLSDNDHRITRRIFIHIKGIEQNAFLLAKEHNIWVWDLKELNNVLRLFGGYEIVL